MATDPNSILNHCDPITTLQDAKQPILTPLLPVKGLRRDASGNLTEDAIQTIFEGLRSLGLATASQEMKDAILTESKDVLCKLNAQYRFLMDMFLTSMARGEPVDPAMIALLKEKNQLMQDILSLSRHVLTMPTESFVGGVVIKEGFADESFAKRFKQYEGFTNISKTLQREYFTIESGNYENLKQRVLEDTEEKNRYTLRQIGMYSFLNVFAVGLIVYISSYT
jgi:hypothetical protein